MPSSADFLRKALRLAVRGRYGVAPNPMVGAVVVRDGAVVGEGYHRRHGGPHAETEALARAGDRARGATVYLNLEPCAHHGNTPPCCEALIAAGVARVVACHGDPDPRTAGSGFERLRAAGIGVEVGELAAEAATLNLRFLAPHALKRPAVTLKWAMSLDGKIATASGESQWISSPAGRRWALLERETHQAILVGSGTALADDPRLNRRMGRAPGPIVRVVLDRRLRLPPDARLFTVPGPVLVYTAAGADPGAVAALERAGATVVGCLPDPGSSSGPSSGPSSGSPAGSDPASGLDPMLADLLDRKVQSVLVEGGSQVAGAFLASGRFDRVAVDCAPKLLGGEGAPGPLGGPGVGRLDEAPRLDRVRIRRRGGDLILTGLREGCLRDLLRSVDTSSGTRRRPPAAG